MSEFKSKTFVFMMELVIVLWSILVVLAQLSNSYPNFQKHIPNGENVHFAGEKWRAVGHNKVYGAGGLNKFGKAFRAAGEEWTKELCQADSDEGK